MKPKFFTLFAALTLSAGALFASDTAVNGIYYGFDDPTRTAKVTYRGSSASEYDEYTGDVVIPATVTYGGKSYSVTSIKDGAFSGCSGLTSVTIPNSVTSIGRYAFDGTAWLANQPDGVIYINQSLYTYKGKMPANTSIVVRDGTIQICGGAFYNCSGLTSVTIPNSVTSIGGNAFKGCSGLTSVVWNAKNCANFSYNSAPFYDIKSQITSFTFGSEVEHIPAYLCCGMKNLTSVTIPNSVTSIGDYAFSGCSGLTSVTIPNSVTSIGQKAFSGCSGLTSVTIPNSVTSIGQKAFDGTAWLENQPDGVIYINQSLYTYKGEMPANTSIVVRDGTTQICGGAFWRCSGLTSVTIPNSVTSIGGEAIGGEAFEGCSGLTKTNYTGDIAGWCGINFVGVGSNPTAYSLNLYINDVEVKDLVIPDGVTSIGMYAFSGCSGLTSVTIPNSVTSIEEGAFYECSGLTSVTIPNSVTSIGSWAFYGCSGLNSVTIPNSVTSIGDRAFCGCSGLTSVTIGNSVTSIGGAAFSGCTALYEITALPTVPPTCGSNAFYNVPTGATLRCPCASREDYQAADTWSQFTNIIPADFPNVTLLADEEQGSVQVEDRICESKSIVISATPAEGYSFVQWSDGNTENPRTITVTEDITLSAEFAPSQTALETVTLSPVYAVDGRIVCEGEFRIYDLLGRDVTRLNGSLCGVYVVQTADAAQKVVVR